MTEGTVREFGDSVADDRLEEAAEWFLRVRSEGAHGEDLAELQRWMERDPQNAFAYQQISAAWNTVGTHGSAPEVMVSRRDALEDSRKAARRRWSAKSLLPFGWGLAASALLAVAAASAWFWAHRGDVYATDLGERRTVMLEDGSVVTLDAKSRVRVRFTAKERAVALEEGQARFSVAKDALRAFRVRARDQTVVALGTQFNVELVAGSVLVTLLEGHVAVTGVEPDSLSSRGVPQGAEATRPPGEDSGVNSGRKQDIRDRTRRTVELNAGEALRIRQNGQATVVPNVDLERVTAWEAGRLFFDDESLASAAERVNRYAHRPVVVDPSVAQLGISGVFNAGDADAFVEAVTAYFPVRVDTSDVSEVRLTARK